MQLFDTTELQQLCLSKYDSVQGLAAQLQKREATSQKRKQTLAVKAASRVDVAPYEEDLDDEDERGYGDYDDGNDLVCPGCGF